MTRTFQLRINGQPAGPIRSSWIDAAQDAVDVGYGKWKVMNTNDFTLINGPGVVVHASITED